MDWYLRLHRAKRFFFYYAPLEGIDRSRFARINHFATWHRFIFRPSKRQIKAPVANITSGKSIMTRLLKRFVDNESGATAIEYALICMLVACAIIASVTVIGTKLQNTFNEVASNLK